MFQLEHGMYPLVLIEVLAVAEVKETSTGFTYLKALATLRLDGVESLFESSTVYPRVVLHADVARNDVITADGKLHLCGAVFRAVPIPKYQAHVSPHVGISHVLFARGSDPEYYYHIRVERAYQGANDPLARVFGA